MARSVLVDAGFIVALLSKRDTHHQWAASQAANFPPPWSSCEAAVSEAYHLLGAHATAVSALLRRRAIVLRFQFAEQLDPTTRLIEKYSNLPMSLADACLVRMTELFADSVILTTDQDFRIYRRHGRQVVPCVTPK